jgi:hypothetical protein
MTAVALPLSRLGSGSLSFRLPRATPGRLSFVLYAVLGGYLALVLHAFHGDAYSRVANAYYVLFSRDPHLAAIGFVWTPLPSLFELVLLPAKLIWPELTKMGFAAVVMSATFMALAVREVDRILADFALGRRTRLALVAAFALHPAIVYYGAIGTSEAPTLYFALLACRHLSRYATSPSTSSLIGVGIAIAGAFLTRYEAVPAAVGVAAMIMLLGLLRLPGTTRERLARASADLIVALVPFVLVFVGWSLASWMVVGSPFTQFTSDYGNSSQMRVWAAAGANEIGLPLGPSIVLAGLRLSALSIAAPVALLAALWALVARRDYRVLAIGAVLGPVLLFMILAYVLHLLAPWLRYFITIVPMGVLLVGLVMSPLARPPQAASSAWRWRSVVRPVRDRILALRARLGATDRRAAEAAVRKAHAFGILASLFAKWTAARAQHAASSAERVRIAALLVGSKAWNAVLPVGARMSPVLAKAAPIRASLGRLLANLSPAHDRLVSLAATARDRWAPAKTRLTAYRVSLNDRAGLLVVRANLISAAIAEWEAAAVSWLAPRVVSLRQRLVVLARQAMDVGRNGAKVGSRTLAGMRSFRGVLGWLFAALKPRVARLAPAAILALAVLSAPVAAAGMLNPSVAVEESKDIAALLGPSAAAPDRPGAAVRTFAGEQAVASYLDGMQLPRGAVLMDVFSGFPIALLSDRPEQFVITTDKDFKQALADPPTFGVQYLLAPSVGGHGVLDAVNQAYPDLATENDYATSVHRFPALGTSSSWTLYRLTAAAKSTSH